MRKNGMILLNNKLQNNKQMKKEILKSQRLQEMKELIKLKKQLIYFLNM